MNYLSWGRENDGNGECGKLGKHRSRHFDIFVWCNLVRQALAVVTNHSLGKFIEVPEREDGLDLSHRLTASAAFI